MLMNKPNIKPGWKRFNFSVSPEIKAYLTWVQRTKHIPRSVYVRKLVEKQMKIDPQE
jgi:hypothetical protein